jgi:Skp family chaperone for outer membrane proteins
MKGRWILGSVALVMLGYALAVAADTTRGPSKIAFISVNRLIAQSPDVQTEVGKLRATQKEMFTTLRQKQQALEQTRRALSNATGAERARLQAQEKEQAADLQKATTQAQADLQASQRETMVALQSHLKPVLDDIGRREGLDAVLNGDVAIFWGSTKLDITSDVIQRLNADAGKGGAKP